jgi:alkyl hydroperoxide reductase subunit AhpC
VTLLVPRTRIAAKRQRFHELVDAIASHRHHGYITPAEWFEEAAEIARWFDAEAEKSSLAPSKFPGEFGDAR